MNFQWGEGFHPPKTASGEIIPVESVWASISSLPEPSPENLFEATKAKRHVLHDELWAEGDQVWANRARLDRCRKIISAVKETVVVGGKNIEVRAVEFVRSNGAGRWVRIDDVRSDPELLDAYLASVQSMQEQATAKMMKVRELMRS